MLCFSCDDYQRTLIAFQEHVTNLYMVQIEPKHVRQFRDTLLAVGRSWYKDGNPNFSPAPTGERLKPRTVVKQLKNLITFFNWALKEEVVQRNPAAGIDLPTVAANRTRPPPAELVDALCQMPFPSAPTVGCLEWECMPWFYRYTGARCGEIGQLRLRDVRMVEGVLVLDIATLKTTSRSDQSDESKRRLVPVAEKLRPYVDRMLAARQGKGPDELVFELAGHREITSRSGFPYLRYAWRFSNLYNRHAKRIANTHLHCWRSYAISQMAKAGIHDEVRRRIVGHARTGVHDGYTHIGLNQLKAAVDTIA